MASQTGEEPRVPPLRAVIADCCAQCLLVLGCCEELAIRTVCH
jgi:hypothetical protein